MWAEQLLWQRLVLSRNSSKALVDGLLQPLKDIFAKTLSCYMHSFFCDHPIMTQTLPNYEPSFPSVFIAYSSLHSWTFPPYFALHICHHCICSSLFLDTYPPKKPLHLNPPLSLDRILAPSHALYKFESSLGFQTRDMLFCLTTTHLH